jgi:hypothetical protein
MILSKKSIENIIIQIYLYVISVDIIKKHIIYYLSSTMSKWMLIKFVKINAGPDLEED